MGLINPSTLYSGGNVKLDSTPYLRIALQERAKKEARQQAIDQYYQKLPETINDKGVREQEVPLIGEIKNKMMEYWMKNRDALKKGDHNAQIGMQRLYREGQGITRSSQNAAKIDMATGRFALDKNNKDVLSNDGFVERHRLQSLPVTDPNYKPLDLTEEISNRPFNMENYIKEIKDNFKYGEGTPTITPHPTDKFSEVVTSNPVLDDTTKQNLYAYSSAKLHNDPAFERALKKDYATTEQLAPLNELSKKAFGHEIEKPEDIAAAYTLSLLPNKGVVSKVKKSMSAVNSEWDRRHAIQQADWLKHNKITYDQSLNKIRVNNDKTGVYEVDDVPGLLLKDSSYMDIPFFGRSKVVDISKLPEGYRQDILGTKDNRGMQRSGYMVDGKELLVVSPDGQFIGEGFTVNPKDIQLSTMKRTAPLEKPIGTNKAKLRNEESGDKKESTAPATSKWDKYKKN